MAACRSSGAGGAINPSSGAGREPSDDRMPKNSVLMSPSYSSKTNCPVLRKMNFSQRNWMKGVCASGYSRQESNQTLYLRLRKCFVMACESLVVSREAGFRAQGARARAGQQHCAGDI